jgi:hypothetical protein
MKKKYRDITVDGELYAWMTSCQTLTIWKNKKVIITQDVSHITVTPGIVAESIKEYNKERIL